MNWVLCALSAAGVAALVKYFVDRARVNAALTALARPDRTAEIKEIATLTEQVAEAKIEYSAAKRLVGEPIVVPESDIKSSLKIISSIGNILHGAVQNPTGVSDESSSASTTSVSINGLMGGSRTANVQRRPKD